MATPHDHLPDERRILDCAFELATKANCESGHTEAKQELQRRFPDIPADRIPELFARAAALEAASFDVADQCRDKLKTDDEALDALRSDYPGFAPETYRRALSWGYYQSR